MNIAANEKERLARILCAPEAKKLPQLAQQLAYKSDLSADAAIEVMAVAAKAAPAPSAPPPPSAYPGPRLVGEPHGTPSAPPAGRDSWAEVAAAINAEAARAHPGFIIPQ